VDQARVFERIERGVRRSGAGLGLALVKSLIEVHGGTIVIESASGQGTRITCRLPVAQHPARAPAESEFDDEARALTPPAS
jgi:signal transduction histidine kinase